MTPSHDFELREAVVLKSRPDVQELITNPPNDDESLCLNLTKQATWLEGWLDDAIDSVPELAICYNHKILDQSNYWLCKSSNEDVVQLSDIYSESESSSTSPLSLAVRACAHEQFARLILNNQEFALQQQVKIGVLSLSLDPVTFSEEEFTENMSVPCKQLVRQGQHHAPLLQTRISPISSKLAAVHHVSQAVKSLIWTRQILSSSEESDICKLLARKLWSLLLLLGESYLCLGEAYKNSGQLQQALNTIELACSVYGSMQPKSFFVSAIQLKFQNTDEVFNLGLASKPLFWANVWLVVGDICTKFHEVEAEHALSPLKLPYEVEDELERIKTHSKKCASCSLVNCFCAPQTSKKNNKPSGRGGIFKYLKTAVNNDVESNMLCALDCFEEAHRALVELELPSGCKEVIKRKGLVLNAIGLNRLSRKAFKEAEDAFAGAIAAFRKIEDGDSIIRLNLNLGSTRRDAAEKSFSKVESVRPYKKARDLAIREYLCAIKYYLSAKTELGESSSVLKVDVYKQLGDAFLRLGIHLSKDDTTANRLSASDYMIEAINLYEMIDLKTDVGGAYIQLADYHKRKFLVLKSDLERANQQYLLAGKYWSKSLAIFGPENHPSVFLFIMIQDTDLTFSFAERFKAGLSSETLDSLLCRFFEARHISKMDEESLERQLPEFWRLLQKILKLFLVLSSKDPEAKQVKEKLKDLYRKALEPVKRLSVLNSMQLSWAAESSKNSQ